MATAATNEDVSMSRYSSGCKCTVTFWEGLFILLCISCWLCIGFWQQTQVQGQCWHILRMHALRERLFVDIQSNQEVVHTHKMSVVFVQKGHGLKPIWRCWRCQIGVR